MPVKNIATTDKVLRLKSVMALVSLSKSTIYAGVKEGTFPSPIILGKRAVGWLLSSLIKWLEDRNTSRNNPINQRLITCSNPAAPRQILEVGKQLSPA
jgi:prophage regulatory protein